MTRALDIQTAVIFFPEEGGLSSITSFQPIAGLPVLQRQLLWLRQHDIATAHISAPPQLHAAIGARIQLWRKNRSIPQVVLHSEEARVSLKMPETAVLLDGRFLHHPGLLAHALLAKAPFVYVDDQGCLCGLGVASLQSDVSADILHSLPRVRLPEGCFARTTASPTEAREAEKRLYKSFIKSTDGWFSKHLDRPISLSITRRIVNLPLHPHPITLFTLLVGIGSGWCAAQGSFLHLAAGGVLFLAASILDGVDGELARAKLLQSKTGEWLDTTCDDLTNAVFILGVTWGVYRRTQDLFWLALGVLSLVIYAGTLLLMYGNLIISRRQGTLLEFQEEIRKPGYHPGPMKAALVSLQPFIKRDFYAWAFMICCLLDFSKLILSGWSIGAFFTLGFIWTEWESPFSGKLSEKIKRKWRRH
jgi:phosphatidylglycerophosphate synthase